MEDRKQEGLRVYNTLHNKKEPFVPLTPSVAGMYVCGVTVYDECHLGHARAYVSFDVIRRYLEYSGYSVKHVQNFTDIDDKIINRAREARARAGDEMTLEEACAAITARYTEDYFEQMDALNIKRAEVYPKATEHIAEMIEIVRRLVDTGFAYPAESGVYFSVDKFKGYGELSGRELSDMQAGARVKTDEGKQNPMDFVLWKKARDDEPAWDSPFGRGRPGWHIECSAMSMKYLGEVFDIHGGGADLVFPHNENEIAQSKALTGKNPASYWLHNGFVTIEKDKMSKSLGNFSTVREVLKTHSPEAVRIFFLSAHYRSPVDFNEEELVKAQKKYDRLAECDRKIASMSTDKTKPERESPEAKKFLEDFKEHMDNDFNTPGAIAAVFELVRHINSCADDGSLADAAGKFMVMREVLGLPVKLEKPCFIDRKEAAAAEIMPDEELAVLLRAEPPDEEAVRALLTQREALRGNKNWEKADLIRNHLEKYARIKDTPEGVSWEKL